MTNYQLNFISSYDALPRNADFYLINVASSVKEAHTIQNKVLDAMENAQLTHTYIYSRKNPHELYEALKGDYFTNTDYGVLLSIFFQTRNALEQSLVQLQSVLTTHKAPILPYFHSCDKAPVLHYGKACITAEGNLQALEGDTFIDSLIQEFSSNPPKVIPTNYQLGKILASRARGSLFEVVKNAQRYLLKEARRHYETSYEGIDALKRCQQERIILEELKHFPFINRVTDYWETDFAAFLVKSYIPGKPLHLAYKTLSAVDKKTVFTAVIKQLEEIHAYGWVWLDLKPSNIVVDEHLAVYFIDMESACPIEEIESTPTWTTPYYAPENPKKLRTSETGWLLDYFATAVSLLQLELNLEGRSASGNYKSFDVFYSEAYELQQQRPQISLLLEGLHRLNSNTKSEETLANNYRIYEELSTLINKLAP